MSNQQLIPIREIQMEFAAFSTHPTERDGVISFGEGLVNAVEILGLEFKGASDVTGLEGYKTPYGSLRSCLRWRSTDVTGDVIKIKWRIQYDATFA